MYCVVYAILHTLKNSGGYCGIAGPGSHTESYAFSERKTVFLLSEHSITLGLVTERSQALLMA